MKRYVVGDIHGSAKGLRQCLNRCRFDYDNDLLICIGDLCDGYPETRQVLDILLEVKHLVLILGNHDVKLFNWLSKGIIADNWLRIGGLGSMESFLIYPNREILNLDTFHLEIDKKYLNLLSQLKPYHILDNKLFVHAGVNDKRLIKKNNKRTLYSNRTFWRKAKKYDKQKLKFKLHEYSNSNVIQEIFIGHSPVNTNTNSLPERRSNVWNVDTGAGNGGKLSIMDIDNKRTWQSDYSKKLYTK